MPKRSSLLALAVIACSRSTDSSSVKTEDVVMHLADDTQEHANVDAGSLTSSQTTGSWIVFGSDAVLQPDGGVVAEDGGAPHVKSVRLQEQERRVEWWQAASMGSDEHVAVEGSKKVIEADDKKTKFDFLGSPLKWVGLGALVLGALAVLYKFRKVIPFLKWVP